MQRFPGSQALLPWVAALSLLGSACASRMVPLTQEIRLQNNLSDEELKGLQYYLSDDVVLRRVVESQDRRVTGSHRLQLVAGKMVEQIVIEKGTPGVATAIGPDTISVSFEPDASLQFSLRRIADTSMPATLEAGRFANDPNPFPANRNEDAPPPMIPSRRRDSRSEASTGIFWLGLDPASSLVPYAGKLFEPLGETPQAHLMVKSESLEDVVETKRVLPGRRLSEGAAPAPPASKSAK